VAVEAVLRRRLVAGLNGDQADRERGVLIAGKGEDAGDVDEGNRGAVGEVVGSRVTGPDLHAGPGARHFAALPGFRIGPRAALGGAQDRGPGVLRRPARRARQGQGDCNRDEKEGAKAAEHGASLLKDHGEGKRWGGQPAGTKISIYQEPGPRKPVQYLTP